ncbi:MAG: hypothetical protein KC546_03015 [Anaerolineae bacterium]|nr:hypothetical protein [Anaerolineae bacterium]
MIDTAVIVATSDASTNPILPDHRPILWPVLGKPMIIQVIEPLYRLGIHNFAVLIGVEDTVALSELQRRWMPDIKIEVSMVMPGESLGLAIQRIFSAISHQSPNFILMGHNTFLDDETLTSVVNSSERCMVQSASDQDSVCCVAVSVEDIESAAKGSQPKSLSEIMRALAKSTAKTIKQASWHIQVNRLDDLYALHEHLLETKEDPYILSEISDTVKIVPPVRIDPQVSIGQGSVIGPYVYLERGARVGYRAHIDHALILDRGNVDANETVQHAIITKSGRVHLA